MSAAIADNIFRGYDIRGKIPEELNPEGAYVLGRAYGSWLSQRRINEAIIVGDNRTHTEELKTNFVKGLLETGINVTDCGLGLVYFMYFGQYLWQIKGGVSVSASHNPKEYNGFKLAVGFSDTMVSEEIIEFKKLVKSGKFTKADKPGTLVKKDVFPAYLADLKRKFPEEFEFKIVLDCGNGTPGKFLPEILRSFGCRVIEQNTQLDGNYPLGTPDPTEADYLTRLAQGVVKNKAALGVCYDPDGDRLGIVDESGNKEGFNQIDKNASCNQNQKNSQPTAFRNSILKSLSCRFQIFDYFLYINQDLNNLSACGQSTTFHQALT